MSSKWVALCRPRARLSQQHLQLKSHFPPPSTRLNSPPAAQISTPTPSMQRGITSARSRRPSIPSKAPVLPARVVQVQCTRGAKRSTTVSLSSLSQGPLEDVEPLPPMEQSTGPEYSAMYAQVRANMNKFSNCVLLTRVGGFYELYFEHAEKFGPLLNLKVGRKKTNAGIIAMAGFPYSQLDRNLKLLVQEHNYHVAISEEYQNPEKLNPSHPAFGMQFDRRVARIITRGTLIDEKFMDPYENNFLLSVATEPERLARARRVIEGEVVSDDIRLGLAWLDLSTGDFFTQESSMSVFVSDLARIGPREIILGSDMKDHIASLPDLQVQRHLVTFLSSSEEAAAKKQGSGTHSWSAYFQAGAEDAAPSVKFSEAEISAGWNLLTYVEEKLQGLTMKLQPPMRRLADDNVFIDANTMRSLEVKSTLQEGVVGGRGSLIREVRRTVTKSGARKLTNWLTSPETSIRVINDRLSLVELFLHDSKIRDLVQRQLRLSHDSLRLLQRLTLGRGDADDLLELAKTIDACGAIYAMLRKLSPDKPEMDAALTALLDRMEVPIDLSKLITTSIDEDGLMLQQRIDESAQAEAAEEGAGAVDAAMEKDVELENGDPISKTKLRGRKPKGTGRLVKVEDREKFEAWVMRREASAMLQVLHESLERQMHDKKEMEAEIREQVELPSLALKWTPMLGHIVHVKTSRKVGLYGRMREAKLVSSSKSTQSFHLPEWTYLGSQIEVTRMQIRAEEQRVLSEIRNKVLTKIIPLRRNAAVLDEMDIACSFAVLAEEQKLVRPILNMGASHKIIGGRHLVVEEGLQRQGRTFIANDCMVGEKERIWLITGPNMAGKSTFLRQNALISILAQAGSFVPAEYAEIGIVDKIFSRVGSADNLYRDQSTFKVEMNETTAILKQATPRSFVIMDEVGRGTTPSDGIAIAYGAIHHLHTINRSRTLFATHFHVLADLAQRDELKSMGCYCTDVVELPPGKKLSDIGIKEEDVITIGEDNAFAYVHRLKRGINTRSHAIKVARMAGLPEEAIKVAEKVLNGHYEGIDTLLPTRPQPDREVFDDLWHEDDGEMSDHLENYMSDMETRLQGVTTATSTPTPTTATTTTTTTTIPTEPGLDEEKESLREIVRYLAGEWAEEEGIHGMTVDEVVEDLTNDLWNHLTESGLMNDEAQLMEAAERWWNDRVENRDAQNVGNHIS